MSADFGLEPVNLTISIDLKHEILMEPIARLIICTPIPDYVFKARGTIPYFGQEGIFVGNKSEAWGSHGVRCQGKDCSLGAMKNCVSLDYQIISANYNIKCYRTKFHIVGIKDYDNIKIISETFVKKLNSLSKVWMKFFRLSTKERKVWIKTVIVPLLFKGGTTKGKPRKPDEAFVEEVKKAMEENHYMRNVVRCFASFLYHWTSRDSLMDKINDVCFMSVGDESVFTSKKNIKVKKVTILDGTYMGKLPVEKDILLGYTALELVNKGISSTFFNQRGKFFLVPVNTGLEDKRITKNGSKLPTHQISVYNTGHIRVNSPGDIDVVYKVCIRILKKIYKIIQNSSEMDDDDENVIKRVRENLARERKD